MREIVAIIVATFFAAIVPTAYFTVLGQPFAGSVLAFELALLGVVVLGLPTFLLFRCFGLVRWWSAVLAGFVLGTVPVAFVLWPYHPGSSSSYSAWDGHELTHYIVRGIPTHAGWADYLLRSGHAGLLAAASAAAFWLVWRAIVGPNYSSKRTREQPRAA